MLEAQKLKSEYHSFLLSFALGVSTIPQATLQAQGDIEAVASTADSPLIVGYLENGTFGWAFSTSEDIAITSLGWLDSGSNISNTVLPPLSIGVWSENGALLRSVVIGNASQPVNGSVYNSISPLFVAAGTTLVVAGGISGAQSVSFVGVLGAPTVFPITFVGVGFSQGNGFSFPTITPDTSADPEAAIPLVTFRFQQVPEPGTGRLIFCGVILLCVSHSCQFLSMVKRRLFRQGRVDEIKVGLRGASGPKILKAAGEDAAAQSDDGVGSAH